MFYNEKGEKMVRIAEGAETATLWARIKSQNFRNG
jgi:hypothetical protein